MWQKIIYILFVLNTLNSVSADYVEASLLYSIKGLMEGLAKDVHDSREMSNISFLKSDIQLLRADFQSLRTEVEKSKLDRHKNHELTKENQLESLKAELEQKENNKESQYQSLKLDMESQIQSLKAELKQKEKDMESQIQTLKVELDRVKNELKNLSIKPDPSLCTKGNSSGVYDLKLSNNLTFPVFCDAETHDGGWTVILRRIDGSEDFYRNWTEYKNGFGNLSGEFFLGLDKIHALTAERAQELLIVIETFEGDKAFETYDNFAIGNEDEQYVLRSVGNAAGTAGDALSDSLNEKFSTRDRDNGKNDGNCAQGYSGAWWYNKDCGYSNLMGIYKESDGSVYWSSFRYLTSLKKAVMMIRPKK